MGLACTSGTEDERDFLQTLCVFALPAPPAQPPPSALLSCPPKKQNPGSRVGFPK